MTKHAALLFFIYFALFFLTGCENRNENEIDIFSASVFDKKLEDLKPIVTKPSTEKMAFVEKGFFVMGSDRGQLSNKPPHDVYLDAFYIDKYEVTYAEYFSLMKNSGWRKHRHENNAELDRDLPATWLTWFDAAAYCKLAGKRLPTEAEWEKAARGGTKELKFPWGDELDKTMANTIPENIMRGGQFPPNQFGLYDMIGNVWEYCQDWYEEFAYIKESYKNPQGPEKARYKVIRGGSWDSIGRTATLYDRSRIARYGEGSDIGFRCALDAKE